MINYCDCIVACREPGDGRWTCQPGLSHRIGPLKCPWTLCSYRSSCRSTGSRISTGSGCTGHSRRAAGPDSKELSRFVIRACVLIPYTGFSISARIKSNTQVTAGCAGSISCNGKAECPDTCSITVISIAVARPTGISGCRAVTTRETPVKIISHRPDRIITRTGDAIGIPGPGTVIDTPGIYRCGASTGD